jgi:hypothetical protein
VLRLIVLTKASPGACDLAFKLLYTYLWMFVHLS